MYTIEQIKGVRNKNPQYKGILDNIWEEAGKDMMTPTNDEEYTDTPTQRRLLNSHFELLLKNIDFDLLCNRMVLSADPKTLTSNQNFIDDVFYSNFPSKGTPTKGAKVIHQRRKEKTGRRKRKDLYKKVQNGLRSDPKIITQQIIAGTYREEEAGIPSTAEPFSQNIFETKSVIDSPHLEAQQVRNELLLPVTEAEVKGVLVKKSRGSPGYDGYTWKDLKKVNISILVSCCNLWLLSGMAPTGMAKGITTLIPKVIGTANPGEFRPITVTSTFSRLHHCILGEIFSNTLPYNDRQKGFKKGDGLYFNTKLLQRTISEAKANYKNLKVAFVDVAKAFDSVSHQTLWVACRGLGVPEHIVGYLRHFYKEGTTRIKLPGKLGRVIEIKQGIKQGDPLSVHLFNAVMELCTEKLDDDIGYKFKNGANLTFMAYADDIILFSKTESGLKQNFKILEDQLALCGLNINYRKGATLGINSKRKKWVCNPKPILKNDQGTITALTINDTYKYLGVKIGALGAIHTPKEDYIKAMENITKAPLKLQQRLKILREHLIPKLLH